jgi:hypothetical protein
LQFANDTGDEAIEPCTNKAAQPEAMATGATNKKPKRKKKQNHHHHHQAPLAKQSTRPKRENLLSFSPLPPKNQKTKKKIHKKFTTQKILHTQVRSKRAIVSLSLLSLVLYLGVFCDGDNLWCVCVGVLYL